MLYVEQSLNPNEDIIKIGKFHWLYTVNAAFWIVIGFGLMCGVLYAGYYWEVSRTVSGQFQGLPVHLKAQAWDEVVRQKGGFFSIISGLHFGFKIGAFLSLLFGIFSFTSMMVRKATTEICITTDRLILKKGVVARHVDEINVDRIEGVNVIQGVVGRIANYGLVIVRGMGVGEVTLPQIADPISFRRAIDRAKSLDGGQKDIDL
ncbi:MAG: hypothetical protein COB76_03865 [Alphaproteobacteria bacterium]|nr:MAG: hypothetical protein COB76_03865 [Alphaproteobacteria bacterium]